MESIKEPHYTINCEQDVIEYECESPDAHWRFKDAEGHVHKWEKSDGQWTLPTVSFVIDGTEFVGDEYESEEVEYGHQECKICGETVRPQSIREQRHEPSGVVRVSGTVKSNQEFPVNKIIEASLLGLPTPGTMILTSSICLSKRPVQYLYEFEMIPESCLDAH